MTEPRNAALSDALRPAMSETLIQTILEEYRYES